MFSLLGVSWTSAGFNKPRVEGSVFSCDAVSVPLKAINGTPSNTAGRVFSFLKAVLNWAPLKNNNINVRHDACEIVYEYASNNC